MKTGLVKRTIGPNESITVLLVHRPSSSKIMRSKRTIITPSVPRTNDYSSLCTPNHTTTLKFISKWTLPHYNFTKDHRKGVRRDLGFTTTTPSPCPLSRPTTATKSSPGLNHETQIMINKGRESKANKTLSLRHVYNFGHYHQRRHYEGVAMGSIYFYLLWKGR